MGIVVVVVIDQPSPGSADRTAGASGVRPPARQPRPRRDDVRRAILDAALRVFADTGYERATMDEVAAWAGFTKGAVYSNFSGKDDLFHALMEQQIAARVEQARQVLDTVGGTSPAGGAPGGVLAEVGRRLTAALTQDRDWQLIFLDYWRRAVRDDAVRERFVGHRRQLRATIADAVEALMGPGPSGWSTFTRDELVTILLALSNGLAIERLTDPAAVPDDLLGRLLSLGDPAG